MATLALTVGGAALGGALLPGGVSVLGATISGAALGAAVGGAVGGAIDQRLLAPGVAPGFARQEGPRLNTVDITASTEGAPIPRLVGRSRLPGQIIWATRFEEEIRTERQTASQTVSGGKGGGGQTVTQTTETTTYHYFANLAVGICEGPVTRIGRIWADGKEIDQTEITIRKHLGDAEQMPDSLIEAKEGAGNAPAYRGLAYVVFERLPLDRFGNRIPVLSFEVTRAVGDLEGEVRGVAVIPGATEFGYDPDRVIRRVGDGEWIGDNRHTLEADSNWQASLDMLADVAPNIETVLLVAAWFGDDLRAGECEIRPKVEGHDRATRKGSSSFNWDVAGLSRGQADRVSFIDGRPAYGGTPNDESVRRAIQDLKSRGLKVVFLPFVMMDIPAGNALPNPYSDGAGETGQPAHPWRGRITVSPAPGLAGSPDKTQAAGDQVDTFVARQWGYRNFILHYATLCAAAGGVDAFLIGSEMVALTTARDGAASYPFVEALIDLAADVRQIVGPATRVSYGADWSEYHSHRPDDGSGDVIFHLDPLWADANIDFVAIDNYLPLADWRDGTEHADYAPSGPTSIHDLDYLKANIEGGEYYDWFYETDADRFAQVRTPIADGAHGEHWVFRNKDIRNWWANPHHDRPGGVRSGSATAWSPQAKPIVFTEFGSPAIDKGANQPNVFVDPKSSESFFPHFSSGGRDDAMQRAYLAATIEHWSDPANNPLSTVYGGAMIDMGRSCVWAWDARMAPSFPQDHRSWADGPNWEVGHWISGRLGAAPAAETVRDLFTRAGFEEHDIGQIGSVVDAVTADRVLSPRAILEAIAPVHMLVAAESGGAVRVRSRLDAGVVASVGLDDLAGEGEAQRYRRTRAQETDLPAAIHLTYGEPTADDRPAGVSAIRQVTGSRRVAEAQAPVVMPAEKAQSAAEAMLFDAWYGRETLVFRLPPSFLALEPGDLIGFAGTNGAFRIDSIAEGPSRRLSLGRMDPGLLVPARAPARQRATPRRVELGPVEYVFIDGPLLHDGHDPHAAYVGAFLKPFAGGVAFWRAPGASGFILDTVVTAPARLGRLAFDFWSGPAWRWDRSNELWVDLMHGELTSAEELAVLAGVNALAIENAEGEWEIVQFAQAELMAPGRYRLTKLLRGQRGSEHAVADPVAAGARVVVLDQALRQTGLGAGERGLPLNWRIGPAARDLADPSYQQEEVTLEAKALRPLAPVHLRGRREHATGDWRLSWTRRTRIGGDSWIQTEVPLAEEAELYDLEILDAPGGDVVRTVNGLQTPEHLYTAAEQTADFGDPVWEVAIRVYQISQAFGRGAPAEALAWHFHEVN